MQLTPLEGVKVLELAGPAPSPFAGLVLADYGADVVRIDRPSTVFGPEDTLCRRKRSIVIDLKSPASCKAFLALVDVADVVIDPYRPGVMDRLGVGSSVLRKRNPRLIYAHLYGFRPDRSSIYAKRAGHDINYLAVSGILSLLGRKGEVPAPPANILGDFAGGGLVCAVGILLALLYRNSTGQGQVVSANMVDGSSYLATFMRQQLPTENCRKPRGENLLDGGAPFYEVCETKDGKFVAVGAQEPQFYAELLRGLEIEPDSLPHPWNERDQWPRVKEIFKAKFKTKTQKEWRAIFDHVDACVTPVLSMEELEPPLQPLVDLSQSASLDVSNQDPFPVLEKGFGCEDVLKEWLPSVSGRRMVIDGKSKTVSRVERPKL